MTRSAAARIRSKRCIAKDVTRGAVADAYRTGPSDGNFEELEGPTHPPFGTGEEQPTFTASDRQLASDERLILVTDGITEGRTENGGRFGIEEWREAVVSGGVRPD